MLTEVEEDIEQGNEESASTHSCCSGNRANLHAAIELSKHSTTTLLLAHRNKWCFTSVQCQKNLQSQLKHASRCSMKSLQHALPWRCSVTDFAVPAYACLLLM